MPRSRSGLIAAASPRSWWKSLGTASTSSTVAPLSPSDSTPAKPRVVGASGGQSNHTVTRSSSSTSVARKNGV
jgi:hypothetical protein